MFFRKKGSSSQVLDGVLGGDSGSLWDLEMLEYELLRWKFSSKREMMFKGEAYYNGDHDIRHYKRTAIGKDGVLEEVRNLPNNRIVDNQYAKLLTQKMNYVLGNPFMLQVNSKVYHKALRGIFSGSFMATAKALAKDAYNFGIAWLFPYYTKNGDLDFRIFPAYEILPFWQDREHTKLDFAVRHYILEEIIDGVSGLVEKVEVYDLHGVHSFILDDGKLYPDYDFSDGQNVHSYCCCEIDGEVCGFNWLEIPLIPFKANSGEISLLKRVKPLQDAINKMMSLFQNAMEEDTRNSVLVIKNYDGTDLDEFRHNLSAYGAVKVKTLDGAAGGIETLKIDVNASNYDSILLLLRRSLVENGMGYEAKSELMGSSPNTLNIKSMYSDVDLDAKDLEVEWFAAFEKLLWFVNQHLYIHGFGDFSGEECRLIFNKDMLQNESEIIENCINSQGLISNSTIISRHPWVSDVLEEMSKIAVESEVLVDELVDVEVAENEVEDFGVDGVVDNAVENLVEG